MDLTTLLGITGAAALAFVNGANDISKSIATLVGSGESSYKRAVILVALSTAAGAILASAWAVKMTLLFTRGMLSPHIKINEIFALAVLAGAILWILMATKIGLPVSTTHAIVGSVILTGVYAFGFRNVFWSSLTRNVVLPLLVSPIAAFVAARLIFQGLFWLCRKKYCLNCHWAHWMSAMSSGFARGLNDTPKIAAFGFIFYYILDPQTHIAPKWFFLILATAMASGAIAMGLQVTKTLAEKITQMDHLEGFAANLATSMLVIIGAIAGWPMSTTHVASGGIMGIGLRNGEKTIDWKTVGEILAAWVITLPVSGMMGMAAYWAFKKLK